MDSFEGLLSIGGKTNSLGRASEVYEIVKTDNTRLDELVACVFSDDAWVRMRAIDTLEKLIRDDSKLAQPYMQVFFGTLTKSTQPSVQWHLAQIFIEVELTRGQRTDAIAWLTQQIQTIEVDWIVSVNCMKSLVYFYTKGLIDAVTINKLFEIQKNHKSSAVRKKAEKLIQQIKN